MPLYPYQETVFNHLMEGRNVIVQAPTGAGKTRAALYPFLTACDDAPDNPWRGKLPSRCIYSVPMQVLAKQFVHAYREVIKEYNLKYRLQLKSAIQTGEQPEDPLLTSNLIFATIDQTLSNYLLAPYSLGRNRANLNAGAILSSYLVFDEFHLYDPTSTLPTTLQMLKTLKGVTPFVLMTATFSEALLGKLADLLGAVIVPGDEAERDALDKLESQQKVRSYRVSDQVLSAEVVWAVHDRRSLVICNTVERARQLHRRLREIASAETEVLLLHSQFLAEDRNRIEDRIRELFGKDAKRDVGSTIAVATQAIEVGVDMSCQALHTELAPANAIIQRAGRCARYKGEKGTVHIYGKTFNPKDVDSDIDLTDGKHYLPYEKQEHLFPLTLAAFREYQGVLEFADEQAVLSTVHNNDDGHLIAQLVQTGNTYQQRVYAVQSGSGTEDARNLIREVRQVQLIIHPEPDGLLKQMEDSPFTLPSFGLHPGSVMGYLKGWQQRADILDTWAVKFLYERKDEARGRLDEERRKPSIEERYEWKLVNVNQDVYAPLLVVNPALATYDPERGLVPDEGGDWQTSPPETTDARQPRNSWGYRLETYADHIRRVHAAFIELWPELAWAAARLEERYGWQSGSIRRAAELAVLLHDVGKLSEGWQRWVREYQQQIAAADHNPALVAQPGQAYAHTESSAPHHKEIERVTEKKIGRRPWHAVEGAISSYPILDALIEAESLKKAALGAIARHHAPFSDENRPYRLIRQARQRIAEAFADTGYTPDFSEIIDAAEREQVSDFLPLPGETEDQGAGFLAYVLIVRALRRADSAGTQAGSRRS